MIYNKGDQPEGYMRHTVDNKSDCSGYEGCGRIAITYSFYNGRQGVRNRYLWCIIITKEINLLKCFLMTDIKIGLKKRLKEVRYWSN